MEAIYEANGTLDLVITLDDALAAKKSGRVFVDGFCGAHGIDLVKIRNVNDAAAVEEVHAHQIDWLFIIGWSQIAKPSILAAPKRGVIGMHPTLLPEGRGRAAIPWAILKGLPETGVTMFQLDAGVDTGPIIAQERIPIAPRETAESLYAQVAAAHRQLMGRVWPELVSDRITLRPQDHSAATEWAGRRPEDGAITPAMTVAEADRLIRATTRPYPGAFWRDDSGLVRIWRGAIGRAQDPPPAGARRIRLSDGVIDALEYELEP